MPAAGKQDFVYLSDEDAYRCPAGEKLKYYYTNEENGQKLRRYWTNACRHCALKVPVMSGIGIFCPCDISEKQTLAPPAEIGGDTHQPGGELHAVAPKEEPSLEDSDNVGDLPKELEDPPDPVPEPRGAVYPQPVAISLNKE